MIQAKTKIIGGHERRCATNGALAGKPTQRRLPKRNEFYDKKLDYFVNKRLITRHIIY